ncbi:MAG TPA: hypothetical protein VIP11_10100 [Gemmatimonadaceae bacterium]
MRILTALLLAATACGHDASSRNAGQPSADCIGVDSPVVITADRIGNLPLDLPLGEIQRRCGPLQWTTTTGDESLDTAIVLSKPGLRVVGAVATVVNEEGSYAVQIDSTTRVRL